MTTTVCKRCAAEGFVGIDTEWCAACEQDYLDYEDYGQDVDYEIERI